MIRFDCRFYEGDKPCRFNKTEGSECPSCSHFSAYKERILFIKLDAIGDVLRSASVLPAIRERHEAAYIAWLTRRESAELVHMMREVDEVIVLGEETTAKLITGNWDQVYSLSNDLTSAALASVAGGKHPPIGFFMHNGILTPSNEAANTWLQMAAFDRLKRSNEASYQELMLRIIGHPNKGVPVPAIDVPIARKIAARTRLDDLFGRTSRPRVAINIGSGGRWPKKMLDAAQISQYARLLLGSEDVDIILVGGDAEVDKAAHILSSFERSEPVRAALTGGSLSEFVAVLCQADVLLSGDTLALHVATAIRLPTIALFGPTSSAEIFDFDGLITKVWTKKLDCLVCYGNCSKEENCMSLLQVPQLVELTRRALRNATVQIRYS